MASENTTSMLNAQTNDARNESIPVGCITFRFSELEYLPWNNADNIVGKAVEAYTSKVRTNALLILFLIGGPANAINMAVFFKQSLKDRVNLLLLSQSLADEVFFIINILTYVEEFYFQFTGGTKRTILMFVLEHNLTFLQSIGIVSFVLSAIIACERCYCVVRPLQYHTLMRTRTLALIIIAVYVIVPGLFFLVVYRYFLGCVYDPDTGAVSIMFLHREFYRRHKDVVDYLDIMVFGVGLPSGTVIVVVTATVITITKLQQAMEWRTETGSSVSAREVALTKMLIGTSVLFIICVSPMCLRRLASLFLPEMNTGRRNENFYLSSIYISQTFLYIKSSFNIFIFYVMGSRYRETFWALFKRKAKGRKKNKK